MRILIYHRRIVLLNSSPILMNRCRTKTIKNLKSWDAATFWTLKTKKKKKFSFLPSRHWDFYLFLQLSTSVWDNNLSLEQLNAWIASFAIGYPTTWAFSVVRNIQIVKMIKNGYTFEHSGFYWFIGRKRTLRSVNMTSQPTQASEFYPEIPVFNSINPEMSYSTFFFFLEKQTILLWKLSVMKYLPLSLVS